MSGSFQLLDIIIIVGICQGIFLSITLQRIINTNHKANNMLSLLLVIATLMLVGRFVYFRYLTYRVFQWSFMVDSIVFLFGPILYMYVKRLLFKEDSKFSMRKVHFAPFIGQLGISGFYLIFYTPEEYYQLFVDGNLSLVFSFVSFLMIVLNIAYLIKSFFLLKTFKRKEKDSFSFEQTPLTYLYFFLFSISACILAWLISFLNTTFLDGYFGYINYESVWVAIPVFIYVIGYFSLKQPELFKIPLEQKPKEKKDRLTEAESGLLKEKLDSLMSNEKAFLQSDLTLGDVADILQTSTNNISWVLNNVYKSTFYDFINGHRINEFVKKIENEEHIRHTILALSMDVGFNSKSTFNKAFKFSMKETPSDFIKKHRAA